MLEEADLRSGKMLCRTSSPPPPCSSPAGSEISVGSPSPPPIGSDSAHPAHLPHPHSLAVTHLVHHHPLVHPHHPHHPAALHAHAAVSALQARAEDYFTPLKRLRMVEGGSGVELASPPGGSPKESISRGSSPTTPINSASSANTVTSPNNSGNSATTLTTSTTTSSNTTKSSSGSTAAEGVKSFSIADILGRDAEAASREGTREPSPPPMNPALHHASLSHHHLHLTGHHPAAHLAAAHHHHHHHHSSSTLQQAASKIVRPWDHLRGPIPVRPFLPPALLHYEHRLALDYHQQLQEHFRAQAQLLRHMSMDIIPSESGSERSSSAASDCCSPEIGRGSDHQSHQSSQSSSSGVGGGSAGAGDGTGRTGANGGSSGAAKSGSKTAPNGTPLDALFQMTNKNFDESNEESVKWELGTVAMPMRDCNAIVNAIETTQWLVEGNTNLPLMAAGELTELEGKTCVMNRRDSSWRPSLLSERERSGAAAKTVPKIPANSRGCHRTAPLERIEGNLGAILSDHAMIAYCRQTDSFLATGSLPLSARRWQLTGPTVNGGDDRRAKRPTLQFAPWICPVPVPL
uniref:Uncharacterized protein n=1 Tax=Anopheles merus TaxID=30066 RepID=A0A182VHN4_ANOME